MNKMDLNGKWDAVCIDRDGNCGFHFEGTVPGSVHTDLSGSHLPADLYFRDNAEQCQWIENCDWQYSRTFQLSNIPDAATLVFEGLDTYADISLNGTFIASTDNMFISHSFDIKKLLRCGENKLTVYFHSPVRRVADLPLCDGAFTRERMHTRRIQCTYGWDWVARFVTCGIWRDVYIDFTSGFHVKDVYVYTENIFENSAQIVIEASFGNYENGGFAEIEILDPEQNSIYRHRWFRKEDFLKEYIDIPHARLWYPAGYGEQPLYTLIINGQTVRFGIRTVSILQLQDQEGSAYYNKCLKIKDTVSGKCYDRNEEFTGFELRINNIPVFCKGANWVPCEPFPSAEQDEKITTLLTLAKKANVNMLRVWGGGIFEKQHFYNECDRLGLLVTQDFLMACGSYPEQEASFTEHMKKEATFAALALRNHPSLVWWSGDNENAIDGFDEAEDYHGRTAIHDGIYPVLNRLDPKRRFLLSSPCGGTPYASKTCGTTHNTQYLGCSIFPYILETDMRDYKEHFAQYLARFIAEEPTMGAVCLPSLLKMMTKEDIVSSDAMWNYHTKSNPGLPFSLFDVLQQFAGKVLGAFTDGKDRYFKLKYIQYEWIRISMENIRRNRGFVNGIVYWMWDDCWPAASGWSFVDYYCLPKASYYSFKRCADTLLASIDKENGEYRIYICNDGMKEENVSLTLSYLRNGAINEVITFGCTVPAAAATCVHTLPCTDIPKDAVLLCDLIADKKQDRAFYKNGTIGIHPSNDVSITEKTADSITLKASAYTHIVELEGPFLFDDNYFSMLPSEEKTVHFRPADTEDHGEITLTVYTL